LFIVFAAFCGSVKRGLWENQSLSSLLTAGLLTLFILCLSMVLVFMLIRKSHIDRAKKISVFFCACEKTLATGVPLAQSIFGGGHFNLGLILLPVLLNQAFQLFIGGLIVQRLARKEAVN
jgi:sodium/bile acid cotransporter 7